MSDDKVVAFRAGDGRPRLKSLSGNEQRAMCQHDEVEIWPREPILECAQCGAVVDPYEWIRKAVGRWKRFEQAAQWKVDELKREADELMAGLRILRAEYKDEAERRRAERAIAHLPPQNRG